MPARRCGYGATFTAEADTEAAILNIGYADGYLRGFSSRGSAFAGEFALPVLGRVSMDLIAVGCDAAPELTEGDWVEIDYDLPSASKQSGLSQYELLTTLGSRFERRWACALFRRRRFGLVAAEVDHRAAPAFGQPRLAGVAAVQDQPVMRVAAEGLGHDLLELRLDLVDGLARREAGAVADAEDVGVDRERLLAERGVEHDIGGLAADARAAPGALRGCAAPRRRDRSISAWLSAMTFFALVLNRPMVLIASRSAPRRSRPSAAGVLIALEQRPAWRC